jgi:hypothetical protein
MGSAVSAPGMNPAQLQSVERVAADQRWVWMIGLGESPANLVLALSLLGLAGAAMDAVTRKDPESGGTSAGFAHDGWLRPPALVAIE